MAPYNFKQITTIPSAKDLVDVMMSKTQRGTPTVVHSGYKITRIRNFYQRKIKFAAQSFRDRLTMIVEQFPHLNDIHPFHSDLLNVLYDRDHFRLALGQINTARTLIDNLAKDYVRLVKYGDSLFRCKQLKRAALGRMCTLIKRLGPSLGYLEQVRMHLARLPSIDPNTRTLVVCGYPNVGKSSFMNCITRADVEVQPYAFTTKSLFVGHCDHKYLRYQAIDTPGILDRPLEERNSVEMLAITALAHLRAAIIFIIDISEQCGYSIEQQLTLFDSIKPLFANKPLLVVLNKIDVVKLENLPAEQQAKLNQLATSLDVQLMSMSTLSEINVSQVKNAACEALLAQRVETKMKGRKVQDVLNRLRVAQPDSTIKPSIPESVLAKRAGAGAMDTDEPRKTERDLEREAGGAGMYSVDLRKHYDLGNDDWKYDPIPEIIDGKNIADWVDPEIEAKLEQLEEEEEERMREAAAEMSPEEDELDEDEELLLSTIRQRRAELRHKAMLNRKKAHLPRTGGQPNNPQALKELMERKGVSNGDEILESFRRGAPKDRARSKTRARSLSRADRDRLMDRDLDGGDDNDEPSRGRMRSRSRGRSLEPRSRSRPRSESGFRPEDQGRAIAMAHKAQRKMNKNARQGESDRRIPDVKPKHLFSGKRGAGKTDRR